MALSLVPIERAPLKDWDALVTRADAPPTLRSAWIRALPMLSPGACAFVLADADSTGALRGGIPLLLRERFGCRSVHSLPCGVYGGVLYDPDRSPQNGSFREMEGVLERLSSARTVEFSMTCLSPPDGHARAPLESTAWRTSQGITQVIDLRAGFEATWQHGFSQCARRSVRRARDRGVVVCSGRSRDLLAEAYRLYWKEAHRGRWNVIYPLSYFEALLAGFPEARVWVARVEGSIVAGKVVVSDGRWLISRLGVVDPNARRSCPHHLLWHDVLRCAAASGVAWADLGPSRGSVTMTRFKTSLGAKPILVQSYRKRSPLMTVWRGVRSATGRMIPKTSS